MEVQNSKAGKGREKKRQKKHVAGNIDTTSEIEILIFPSLEE